MFLVTLTRYVYTLLWCLAIPLVLLRLLWKGQKNKDYLTCIAQRFGFFNSDNKWQGSNNYSNDSANRYWIHAVSVGEVNVALPIIVKLREQNPSLTFLVTTMTPTGKAQLLRSVEKKKLQGVVEHSFVPYDIPLLVSNLLARIKVSKLIVIETELWPNLYHVASKNNIKIYIANMRLSDKSAKNYLQIKRFLQPLMQQVTRFLVQTDSHAEKVIALGAAPEKVKVIGNIKYDIVTDEQSLQQAQSYKKLWSAETTWIAASTHRGEDALLIDAHNQWQQSAKETKGLLILVPRHPERFNEVEKLIEQKNKSCIRLSVIKKALFAEDNSEIISEDDLITLTQRISEVDIILGDTMGDVLSLYESAGLALVAGSLVEGLGGHNILEPILQNKITVHGPYMRNFTKMAEDFANAHGCYCVKDTQSLVKLLQSWSDDSLDSETVLQNAKTVLLQNKNASTRCVEAILN